MSNANELPAIRITEAAKLLGVCRKTATKWARDGILRAVRIGGRYRTTQAWIEAVAKPVVSPVQHMESDGERRRASEAAQQRIKARYGR